MHSYEYIYISTELTDPPQGVGGGEGGSLYLADMNSRTLFYEQ
jgi:hypothetical protein